MPSDQEALDALLAQNDWVRLGDRLSKVNSAQEAWLNLNWEQTKVFNGAGFMMSLTYMRDLWRLGSALPAPKGEEFKNGAGGMFLYNLALTMLDGQRCGDPSAPGHRHDQLISESRPIREYLVNLPRAERMVVGSVVLAEESATSSLRQNDEILCRGGAAEMAHNLQVNGDKPLAVVPSAPGMLPGKTYAVPPDPNFKVSFANPEVWGPKVALTRQKMPDYLTRYLTVPSDSPPSSPPK